MEKLKMRTPDFTDENVARIAELFPNCVTESMDETGTLKRAIDFDQLKQELSASIVDGPAERYQLNWPGKREALLTANAPIAKTLRPCREESVDFDTTRNLFIEGDNLDALKLLSETYLGKVKMIYIDAPYNTGSDFIYEDDFAEDKDAYFERSLQKDEQGNRLVANTESNGRFHSDWMTMMSSRLRLAKNLLTFDGAIFASCDEGEHPRLRLMMDEIFGQGNFVADMVWAAGRKNDSRLISISHEYIICYARDANNIREKSIVWRQRKKGLNEIYSQHAKLLKEFKDDYASITQRLKDWYRDLPDGHPSKAHKHYSHVDFRGVYFPDNISWPGGGGPKYDVIHPKTLKPVKVPSRGWMTSDPKKLNEWIGDQRVHFGEDETSVPCIKSYLKDREMQTPYSVFYQDGRASSKRLRSLMGGDYFEFPKDEIVLQEIISMMTSSHDLILDLFAGSGTTGHSVIAQNAEDGGNRSFLMVQLPEQTDEKSEAYKAGYKTIADVSKERIRRAGEKIKEEAGLNGRNLDIGFRVFTIDTSNMKDVYYSPDEQAQANLLDQIANVKEDRTAEDLLFQVLLDWGVDLALPIARENIEGKEVFFVDENALAACFDVGLNEDFVKELAKRKPLRAVFRDAGFASDDVKINVEQIFKIMSPETEVRSI